MKTDTPATARIAEIRTQASDALRLVDSLHSRAQWDMSGPDADARQRVTTISKNEWRALNGSLESVQFLLDLVQQLSAQGDALTATLESLQEFPACGHWQRRVRRGDGSYQTFERCGICHMREMAATTHRDQVAALTQERDRLLRDWREQDQILQEIAGLVGDEHVTCAADVLTATRARLAEVVPERTGER